MTAAALLLIFAARRGRCSCPAAPAAAAEIVPGEVVVKREGERAAWSQASTTSPRRSRRLRRDDDVEYAAPNPVARAAAFVPNDPGLGARLAGGPVELRSPATASTRPIAWQHAIDAGAPGGARRARSPCSTAASPTPTAGASAARPTSTQTRFVPGYDFVDRDPYPNDENGHGTHVTSTIAESTNNGRGLTGLAYGATIMPVRVLDRNGEGDAARDRRRPSAGPSAAAPTSSTSPSSSAPTSARATSRRCSTRSPTRARRGVLVVGAAGNEGDRILAFPARSTNVFAVGATTEHGCLSDFSNLGRGLDIVAPGGGTDARRRRPELPARRARPAARSSSSRSRAGRCGASACPARTRARRWPRRTSRRPRRSSSPPRVLGPNPTPDAAHRAPQGAPPATSGPPGADTRYGAGLLDAAAATDPPRAARGRRSAARR